MRFSAHRPNPEEHLETEWLLTDGLGGYAMGTMTGINTRRYHGLFVPASAPPLGRIVALHSVLEEVSIEDERNEATPRTIQCGSQMFRTPDDDTVIHPDGWTQLEEAFCDGITMTWRYRIGDVGMLERSIGFEDDAQLVIAYRVEADVPLRVRSRIFTPMRSFHALDVEGENAQPHGAHDVHETRFSRGGSTLCVSSSDTARWIDDPQWWNDFAYVEDRARGQAWTEDVFSPGVFSFSGTMTLRVSLASGGMLHEEDPAASRVDVRGTGSKAYSRSRTWLDHAAQAFVVECRSAPVYRSIIAGYPWFADWGRDAMICIPGLLLCDDRFDDARALLEHFAAHMRNGLIPNCFHDHEREASYNTVDASLWFVYAVWQLARNARDGVSKKLIDACREIIDAYEHGTDFMIRMDARDGLISAGDATMALTWMDARRDERVFTPRHGKPVEINALWHNALRCMVDLEHNDETRARWSTLAAQAGASFREHFWCDDRQCLYDVIPSKASDDDKPDASFRPNQIFAVSLHHSPLEQAMMEAVVEGVASRLLTPYGLRTLDRDDPKYCARYEGDMHERDAAYHNGTVWPWLIGPYCEALLRVRCFSEDAQREVRIALGHLLEAAQKTQGRTCVGQLAEVYDAEPPHRPNGCPAQAWSVSEVRRILRLLERRTPGKHVDQSAS